MENILNYDLHEVSQLDRTGLSHFAIDKLLNTNTGCVKIETKPQIVGDRQFEDLVDDAPARDERVVGTPYKKKKGKSNADPS